MAPRAARELSLGADFEALTQALTQSVLDAGWNLTVAPG
jgi:hypothetical protein